MSTKSVLRTMYDNTLCPTCAAEPNSPCHTKSGRLTYPHVLRMRKYYADQKAALHLKKQQAFFEIAFEIGLATGLEAGLGVAARSMSVTELYELCSDATPPATAAEAYNTWMETQ